MSRYINVDAFERAVMFSDDEDIQDVIYRLRDFPTADVVEVVRCDECKYWDNRFDVMVCNLTDGMKGASDYCSYGERREDEQIR